jgi:hypothetical protein
MRRLAVILAAALAWLISVEGAEARLDILVEKATQRMVVIQNGYMRYIWPVSTGRDEMATPNGVYKPQRLERNWFSSAYYNSPMPYSIFFHNGYAIHGSYAIDKLGGPASHGCVRLHPHHAALLFDLVQQEGPGNTSIEVTDEPPPGVPSSPREMQPVPPREIEAGPGVYPPAPYPVRYREARDMAEPFPVQRANQSVVRNTLSPKPPADVPPLPPRVIEAGPGVYPPAPNLGRYREPRDMAEPTSTQRVNRPPARNTLLSRPPPAGRRMLTELNQPATAPPRAPCGTGGAANESPDCRAKPKAPEAKVAEGKAVEGKAVDGKATEGKVAEAPAPERQQQAKPMYGLKVLPASCWSGGASRWRWWASGQEAPCK